MRKVVINFNDDTNTLILPDGTLYTVATGLKFDDAPDNDILQLVKAGLSAEDLINLRKAELL